VPIKRHRKYYTSLVCVVRSYDNGCR